MAASSSSSSSLSCMQFEWTAKDVSQSKRTPNGSSPVAPKVTSTFNSFIGLLQLPQPIRLSVLERLSISELVQLNISLGQGIASEPNYRPAFNQLQQMMFQIFQNKILQNLLADHPMWTIITWEKIPIDDKIWLLRLYELHELGVKLPQIDALTMGKQKLPCNRSPELLKQRAAIESTLTTIRELDWSYRGLKKCPDAICLLVNLEKLILHHNQLTIAPHVARNLKLRVLDMSDNQLKTGPDITQNIHLQELSLEGNQLTSAPDLKRNVNLQSLKLGHNELTTPPNVTENVHLQELYLSNNPLTSIPNLTRNSKLEKLHIYGSYALTIEAKKQLATIKKERPNLDLLYTFNLSVFC